jgi:hypothetical protein
MLVDGLVVVNLILAAFTFVVEGKNFLRDRRKERWARLINLSAALYITAIYLYIFYIGLVPGTEYTRPGTTLLVTSVLVRAILDIYRIPAEKSSPAGEKSSPAGEKSSPAGEKSSPAGEKSSPTSGK